MAEGEQQESALAFNVGKPAATTLSSELQQQPLSVFQETQDIVKQRNGETQAHTRQKNIPCANFHFVSVFYLPGHLFPTHSVQKSFPVLPPFVTQTMFGGSFNS